MGHTIDETSGSSGFGFSIRSYIAMMTDHQRFILPPSSNRLEPTQRLRWVE